jgi:hypothetical protein
MDLESARGVVMTQGEARVNRARYVGNLASTTDQKERKDLLGEAGQMAAVTVMLDEGAPLRTGD